MTEFAQPVLYEFGDFSPGFQPTGRRMGWTRVASVTPEWLIKQSFKQEDVQFL